MSVDSLLRLLLGRDVIVFNSGDGYIMSGELQHVRDSAYRIVRGGTRLEVIVNLDHILSVNMDFVGGTISIRTDYVVGPRDCEA